jgi:hypothetical protein
MLSSVAPCARNDDFVDALTANCHARVAPRSALPGYPSIAAKTIHKSNKSVVMMPLKEVNHFVDDDIFETMGRLLDQFEV